MAETSHAVPVLAEAERLLAEAESLNPGPWARHSRNVALAAETIAANAGLDSGLARVLGLLHDIGRRVGVTGMRHTLDGYHFLSERGYPGAARICLTHSFPGDDLRFAAVGAGQWDCNEEELEFVDDYLASIEYDDYDRLIQLCDALALPDELCVLEKRFVDIALRHGFNEYTLRKWRAYLDLLERFGALTGRPVYALLGLPGW